MKRILAMLLVLILAIGCFAGCGEDDKKDKNNNPAASATPNKDSGDVSGNETKKEMSFKDISETVTKMENGAEIDIKFSLAIKPIFDEVFTEEAFLAPFNGLIKKNSKGLYEFPVTLSGVMNDKSAKITFKLADKNISDAIVAEEKVYINAKSVFDFIVPIAGGGAAISWPLQGEYIELISLLEMLQGMNQLEDNFENDFSADFEYSEDIEWSDEDLSFAVVPAAEEEYMDEMSANGLLGMFGFTNLDEETKQQIMTLVEVLSTAIPEATLNEIVNKLVVAVQSNNIISFSDDHISIKLDKNNFKGAFLAVADIVRSNGADVIDYVMQAITKSDKIDEAIKEYMTAGYDEYGKDQVKQDLQEMLAAEQLGTVADEILKEIADTHFYVTLAADDNSASFVIDVLIDGTVIVSQKDSTDYEEDSIPMTQVAFVFEIGCKVKDVANITAPTSVISEADIETLLMLFAS